MNFCSPEGLWGVIIFEASESTDVLSDMYPEGAARTVYFFSNADAARQFAERQVQANLSRRVLVLDTVTLQVCSVSVSIAAVNAPVEEAIAQRPARRRGRKLELA